MIDIHTIINMRAMLKTLKGLNKIRALKDFYAVMEQYLEQPICPKCRNTTSTPASFVKPGINGAKCHNCFIHGMFVNIVHRKDLIGDNNGVR